MPTALIIGASRGIGREYVKQLLEGGWEVIATAREEEKLLELKQAGAHALKLDVAEEDAPQILSSHLKGKKLDLAVYVAGVYANQGAKTLISKAEFDAMFHVNTFGAMQLIPVVGPLVEAAKGKFIFLSSQAGSITETYSSATWLYRTSKAALNMAVKAASFDYPKAIFVVMNPGWVRTDIGGPQATLSAEESVRKQLFVITNLVPQESGRYLDYTGYTLSW